MGAEIDRLEVQVEAQATKANNQLDKLVTKLDRVSGALSNLNSGGLTGLSNGVTKFAQASAQLSNVKTADFTRLSKNIEKLAALNTQQIFGAASAMRTLSTAINSLGGVSANSLQVAEIANSISKLGGANVQKAITNLPALATAMNNLIVTLSKAPTVSSNVIQLTRALANLSSQGNKVGSASKSLVKSLNSIGNSMSTNTKKAKSFSSVIGSLYQKFFWVSRGVDKLWDSIESSVDYVETLNYFDAAFGQVADAAVSQWEEAGYDSANAYYESFSSRAKELTSKMTGFSINDDGTLSATGEASLGINPSKLMNYQAMFAQMSSSMGVASETSLKLSQALTEIGADLASVKNMDFDKVWTDMASGLAGMSRTLDKYGVNIRNVNLQQKLNELGINANITALNQNDKALLRTIILLDSTRYAWGDLADTLNQPANQVRLLTSNLSNLSRTIGNLFMPVLSKVLPYINGFVIALQRLVTWVGNLLGIDLSQITSVVGSSEADIGSLIDETDGLGESLDDASKSAKKLKSNLQGFDELNVITTQDDSGSSNIGGGSLPSGLLDSAFDDIFSEYQAAWDKAFGEMENKAQAIADKIEKFFQPVKDIINDFAVGDFFKAGQDTSKLVTGIFDFFSNAIDDVDWQKIGNNIGEYLDGIEWKKIFKSVGNFIETAIEAAIELWEGSFDADPLATTIVTALGVAHFTGLDKTLKDKIIKSFPKDITLSEIIALTIPIALFVKTSTKEGAEDYLGTLEKLHTFDFENMEAHDWLNAILGLGSASVGLSGSFWSSNTLQNDVLESLPQREDYETLEEYNKVLEEWKQKAEEISTMRFQIPGVQYDENGWNKKLTELGNKIFSWWNNDVVPWWNENVNVSAWNETRFEISGLEYDESGWNKTLAEIGAKISSWWNDDVVTWWNNSVVTWWNDDVVPWSTKEKWQELGNNAKEGLIAKCNEFTEWWDGTGIPNWWNNSVTPWFLKEKWEELGQNIESGLSSKWTEFTSWWESTGLYNWWSDDVVPFFTKEAWSWAGIKDGMSESWNNAVEAVKDIWNNFAGWLNDKLNFSWDAFSIGGREIIPAGNLNLGKIPTYSIGGFPEDGLFMANHNELVGQFSNGRTAVANNEQITQGIAEAVYPAVYDAVSAAMANNNRDGDIVINMDGREVFRVTRQYAREYYKKTGSPAF